MRDSPAKPWGKYRRAHGRLMEPGWAGELTDAEFKALQSALERDKALAFWWGWRPATRRRAEAQVRRVALHGDPEDRAANAALVHKKS